MSRRFPNPAASALALLLLALIPAQLAAHCGVPFPSLAGHDHHASAHGPGVSGPEGALRAFGEEGACAIAAPTFTVRREPAPDIFGMPAAFQAAPAALAPSGCSVALPVAVSPAPFGRSSPPLRI